MRFGSGLAAVRDQADAAERERREHEPAPGRAALSARLDRPASTIPRAASAMPVPVPPPTSEKRGALRGARGGRSTRGRPRPPASGSPPLIVIVRAAGARGAGPATRGEQPPSRPARRARSAGPYGPSDAAAGADAALAGAQRAHAGARAARACGRRRRARRPRGGLPVRARTRSADRRPPRRVADRAAVELAPRTRATRCGRAEERDLRLRDAAPRASPESTRTCGGWVCS